MSDSAAVGSEVPTPQSGASLAPELLSSPHVLRLDFHMRGSQAVQMG